MQSADKQYIDQSTKALSTPQWLAHFIDTYNQLSTDNLLLLEELYHQDIVFQDPLHHLTGKSALLNYFNRLYTNIEQCHFNIKHFFYHEKQAAIYWTMTYIHPKLNGGKAIEVSGHSHIKGQGKQVVYHRDYLDAGAMLYEHVPVLGAVIRGLKKRIN